MGFLHINLLYLGALKGAVLPYLSDVQRASTDTFFFHYAEFGSHTWCDTTRHDFSIDAIADAAQRPRFESYQYLPVPRYARTDLGYTSFFDYTYGKHGSCETPSIDAYFSLAAELVERDRLRTEEVFAPFLPQGAERVREVPVYFIRNALEVGNMSHLFMTCDSGNYLKSLDYYYINAPGYSPYTGEPADVANIYDMCTKDDIIRILSRTEPNPDEYNRLNHLTVAAPFASRYSVWIVSGASALLLAAISVFLVVYYKIRAKNYFI